MARLQTSALFRGPLVSVRDVSCRERMSPCGAEEYSEGHVLVFTRSGVFVRHSGSRARVQQQVAEPMQALFFNAGEPFRVSHPADGGDECTSLSFATAAVLDVVSAIDPRVEERAGAPFDVPHAPLSSEVVLRYQSLRRRLQQGAPGLEAEEEALRLLGTVAAKGRAAYGVRKAAARHSTQRERADLVERTKVALAARPGDDWSLARLAQSVAASPYHLTRVFREHVGVPVHRYLVRLRLAIALDRVQGGESDLSALAHGLGFASHSHFATAFRGAYGMSPSSYGRSHGLSGADSFA